MRVVPLYGSRERCLKISGSGSRRLKAPANHSFVAFKRSFDRLNLHVSPLTGHETTMIAFLFQNACFVISTWWVLHRFGELVHLDNTTVLYFEFCQISSLLASFRLRIAEGCGLLCQKGLFEIEFKQAKGRNLLGKRMHPSGSRRNHRPGPSNCWRGQGAVRSVVFLDYCFLVDRFFAFDRSLRLHVGLQIRLYT